MDDAQSKNTTVTVFGSGAAAEVSEAYRLANRLGAGRHVSPGAAATGAATNSGADKRCPPRAVSKCSADPQMLSQSS